MTKTRTTGAIPAVNSLEFKTPTELMSEVGARLRRWRLDVYYSQAALASKAGVSLTALQGLEAGRGSSLVTYVRVLKALGLLDTLDALVPVPQVNPLDMLKMDTPRQRAPKGKS